MRQPRKPTTVDMGVELAFAVPTVMTLRMLGAALPGSRPTVRQQREMHRMVTEKFLAFGNAWLSMSAALISSGQASWMHPWWMMGSSSAALTPLALWGEALRPIHREAMSNVQRLTRRYRR